jgi:hypothetical protein
MNESINHQQQKPHGDASIDNRKTPMVMHQSTIGKDQW